MSADRWSKGDRMLVEMWDDLVPRIPPGFVRFHKEVRVMQLGPDLAMRYSQIYDGLPPLFQTACKVLAVALQTEDFCLPQQILWEVLNDLIAQGVDSDIVDILLKEMEELYIIKLSFKEDERMVAFLTPVSLKGNMSMHCNFPDLQLFFLFSVFS
jgi:hypothetical protein